MRFAPTPTRTPAPGRPCTRHDLRRGADRDNSPARRRIVGSGCLTARRADDSRPGADEDRGTGYDSSTLPTPATPRSIEVRRPLGLYKIHQA